MKLLTHLKDLKSPKAEPSLGFFIPRVNSNRVFISIDVLFSDQKILWWKSPPQLPANKGPAKFYNNVSEQCFSAHETESLFSLVVRLEYS